MDLSALFAVLGLDRISGKEDKDNTKQIADTNITMDVQELKEECKNHPTTK